MNNKWINRISTFTLGWIIALLIWRIIREVGINAYLDLLNFEYSFFSITLAIFCISILAGITFGSTQYVFEKYFTKKISFHNVLLRGLSVHLFIMVLLYLLVYVVIRIGDLGPEMLFREFLASPILLVNLVYSILVNSVITIIIDLNKLLGRGNLGKLLTGKFYSPKEEIRVFMFLDLKGSTSIAEELGHFKYSAFIQDCFYDLYVLEQYGAEVYQYVGDEVVLTWLMNQQNPKTISSCLKAYFVFANQLKSRSDYYQSTYGVLPFFKGGMHVGPVTVVEVGTLKREIAYHGDTLNIAARIQEQCKHFNTSFLVSGSVMEMVEATDQFRFVKQEDKILRGKKKATSMYSVTC